MPRRRLYNVAAGGRRHPAEIAAHELVRRDPNRLVGEASKAGFSRTEALRVLVRGGAPSAFEELGLARREGDADVIAVTVAIAGEAEGREADGFLLDVLVEGDNPRSRTADQLMPRIRGIVPELLDLVDHGDPAVRYWSLMLLATAEPSPAVLGAAVDASTDPDAQVRSGAARALGRYAPAEVMLALRRLLGDDVFFVRAHAARAVAESGAGSLANEVARLLADQNWWVRAAAKESLLRLGRSGLEAAISTLDSDDRFARDSAGEVILGFERSEAAGEVSEALLEQVAG
jgi:HEAT repeat protein